MSRSESFRGACRDPEREDFEGLVRAYGEELFATALRVLGNRARAEDAVQDTFLKAYAAFERLRPGSNVRAWLYRILLNTAYDYLDRVRTRAAAREALVEHYGTHTDEPVGAHLGREELRARVEAAIRSLPRKYRDALLLRAVQGLSYAEVAEALGIPETTARSLVHRGKRLLVPKLRPLMEEGGP